MRKIVSAMVLIVGATIAVVAQDGPYRFIKDIQVGGEGGWDYLSVDSAAKRLYVSHATKAIVIDLAKDAVIGEIADTPGIHGAVAATPGRVFTSNGRENKAGIVDTATWQTIGKVDTEGNPDFIMFEPKQKEVYTFNGRGSSASVIGADSGKLVATIPLGGKPEAAVPDVAAGRVYVNVEDKNSIAVIDVATHKVVENWPIAPGEGATGLAIDTKTHRLFIGAGNKLLVMMDSTNGKVVAQAPTGAGTDSAWFDPGTSYAFVSSGDGTVTVVHEDSPTKLTVIQTLKTLPAARTMTLDPVTHRLYVAAAQFTPAPAGGGRAGVVPNSMHIKVYGIDGK